MPDTFDRLKSALADRYAIQEELGAGGMATVYLAEDLKHHRKVAVKVLRPELAAALGADRFLREIEIAANLAHPHLLPLYDSGEADGFLYYVMPYVEGESLRDLITRERQLPVDDAVRITREVADALTSAHKRDVVHRDIKPENILLQEGHAVVADFGIARAISAAGGEQLTETGLAVGTPAYMSPEQASADQLDGRSDIYALGCVLYEMLAGMAPFTGATPQAVMARHAIDPVPSLSTVRATVPPVVEAAVTKALAKVPADRFATAAEFAEALTRTDAVTPTTATPVVAQVPAEQSIAVLPFANMSADPDNEYFCDGMTEEIINALTHLPGLEVAARTSSFAFKGQNIDVAEIGGKLRVSTVLEGSVRQAGNRLRITAQLINASDGYHIWSERYDREMTDVFAIQDEIAEAIVATLKVKLVGGEEAPLVKRGTDDLEAYHLYLKGRHFWNQRGPHKAIEYFEQAIDKDPHFAHAYAGIADAVCVLGHYGFYPSRDAFAKAKASAERAIAIDNELAEAHHALASTEMYFGWDLRKAETEYRHAITLSPHPATAHVYLACLLSALGEGRWEEATAEAKQAQDLEPLSPIINAIAGLAYHGSRKFSEAIGACQKALEMVPDFGAALWVTSVAYGQMGKHDDAIAAARRSVESMHQSPWTLGVLGFACALAGRREEATTVLNQLAKRSETEYIQPLSSAWIHAALGETDEAFEWFERAFEDRNANAPFIGTAPGLEHIGADPRWGGLLTKAGLGYLVEPAD